MTRVDTDPPVPLDPVFAGIAAQIAGGERPAGPPTAAAVRANIDGTAVTCAPGPQTLTVADDRVAGVPVRRYRPAGDVAAGTVVHLHGGGWAAGGLDYADALCRELCAGTGRETISVDYRLAPEHRYPAGLDDTRAVLTALVDTGPVLLSGDSAGANLAVVAADTLTGGPHIIGRLLIYPVLDTDTARASYRDSADAFLGAGLMEWFLAQYLPPGVDRTDPHIAPLRAAPTADTAPTVLVTGGHDPLRDEAADYAAVLTAAGARVDRLHHPSLPHGFLQFTAVSPVAAAAQSALVVAAARLFDPASEGHNHAS